MSESIRFFITTLGCKVNQYESQALREAWQALGWLDTPETGDSDLILVNSCAVTASAVADVRTAVRRLHRANPAAQIWVMGCSAQTHPEEIKKLPGVSAIIPTALKDDLLNNPFLWLGEKRPAEELPSPPVPGAKRAYPGFEIANYQRARPVLKVQDGCSHRCTYCIVPLARGASVSRNPDAVLAEARRLLAAGFREIILSGINLSQYRAPLTDGLQRGLVDGPPGGDFWALLSLLERELAPEWAGRARLRVSSLEPGQLGEQALEIFAKSRLLCPQLHISLQSGSRSVLSRMGRAHYNPELLPEFCSELAKIWPRFGLGADILTGFPGETEAEFAETANLVQALPMTYAHVFPFSPRPGTRAAAMPGQVGKQTASLRSALLREMIQIKKDRFLDELHTQAARLAIVLESPETSLGVSEYYVECKLASLPFGATAKILLPVRVTGREENRLLVSATLK